MPTATVETWTVWSVAGISVAAFFVIQLPVLVVLDGLGEKQVFRFPLLDANAPEDSSLNSSARRYPRALHCLLTLLRRHR